MHLQKGKKVAQIRPQKQMDDQVLVVYSDAVVGGLGACQGTAARRVDRKALGVEDRQGGMESLVGSSRLRVAAFQFPSTCLCVIASYAR